MEFYLINNSKGKVVFISINKIKASPEEQINTVLANLDYSTSLKNLLQTIKLGITNVAEYSRIIIMLSFQ